MPLFKGVKLCVRSDHADVRRIAVRILLPMSSVLMRAMRRSWEWHFERTSSRPKVLLKSSDQRMYLDVFLGASADQLRD
jgi:hypothetical protein